MTIQQHVLEVSVVKKTQRNVIDVEKQLAADFTVPIYYLALRACMFLLSYVSMA